MPPPAKITKEAILEAGLSIIRSQGPDSLNARSLAAALHCSTQPIFSNFPSMDALRIALAEEAEKIFQYNMEQEIAKKLYPPYKASGMAYIHFAHREPQLFRLLYMRDRRNEEIPQETSLGNQMTHLVQGTTSLDREKANLMHLEMWAAVHGLAVMAATHFLPLEEEIISRMLTDVFQGLKARHEKKEG